MVGHGESNAGSYLVDPTYPIPSHCASIVATSTLRVNPVLIVKLQCRVNYINAGSSCTTDEKVYLGVIAYMHTQPLRKVKVIICKPKLLAFEPCVCSSDLWLSRY